jgi:hypothetical protein
MVFTPVHSVYMADISKSNVIEKNDMAHDLPVENAPHRNNPQHKHAVNMVDEGHMHVSAEDVR